MRRERLRNRRRAGRLHRPVVVLAALTWLGTGLPAAPAGAQSGDDGDDPAQDAVPQPVGLDALLKLPSNTGAPAPRSEIGGFTRAEWVERFEGARAEVRDAESRLAEAQAELEKLASSSESWQVTAPGAPAGSARETGPLSYGLRQEIRSSREDLEQARQDLSELRIEANLAGVPTEWIGEDPVAPPQPTGPLP